MTHDPLGADRLAAAGPDGFPAIHAGRKALRLFTVGHSYAVTLNRRLAHEMATCGGARWEVTVAAPHALHGDLRRLRLAIEPGEPCRVEAIPAHLSGKIHVMVYGRRLRALLREGPWDLVHCWQEPYTFPGGQVAWWTPRRTPLVFFTDQNLPKRYPPPFAQVERYCVDRCAGWIAAGRTVAEAQLGRGYGRRPHRVIPHGVDVEHFRPDAASGAAVRRALGWSEPGPPVVGYLGRLVPEKGLGLLTSTLDRLETPWRALIVGAGPLEGELRAWAGRHAGRAVVATDVTHDRAADYLNAMDLLAAPSQTRPNWREQFGRMLIEAFACGVPVVASDSGEIPHVVADAGRIVGEADEPGWLRALRELVDAPALRAELGARGLERARSLFAWPIVARGHLEFFEELVAAPRR